MKNIAYIYGLFDISNEKIRYIGKSINPKKRLRSHLTEAKNLNINNHKNNWIRSVINNNSKLNYIILETCNENNWKEREIYWINKLRNECKLVNHTDGGNGSQSNIFFYNYIELKKWVISNKPEYVNSKSTFNKWVNINNYSFVPKTPDSVYKNKGWISWADFLDTKNIQSNKLVKNYLNYEECKLWVKNNLNVKSRKEFKGVKNLPIFIPRKCDIIYKNKGWVSWYDFLNKEKKNFISYQESKLWIKNNIGIINKKTFLKLCKENVIPKYIPRKPEFTYKEFFSWYDFLGIKNKRVPKDYLTFNDAKSLVHTLKIKSNKEWKVFIKENTFKLKIPTNPDSLYKNEWISWYDWLGK